MSRPPPSPPPPPPLRVRPAPFAHVEGDHLLVRLLKALFGTPATPRLDDLCRHPPRPPSGGSGVSAPQPRAVRVLVDRNTVFPPLDMDALRRSAWGDPLTPAMARRIAGGHANEARAQLRRLHAAGLAGPDDLQLLAAIDRWAAGDLT